jgi:DNA helicase HerA-like ATPase
MAFLRRNKFRFPGPRDRVSINGMTGSGKSTFAFWLFSESADFDKKPWILIDYKNEDIISEMLANKDAKLIKLDGKLPDKPGIFVLKPEHYEIDAMVNWLWSVYKRGKTGLMFDEISMIPELRGEGNSGGPMKSILSQGRSKEIPLYSLSQRPVDVNKHVYSEANFTAAFRLRSRKDYEKVMDAVPDDNPVWDSTRKLKKYECRWYDAEQDWGAFLGPCPPPDAILDTITKRMNTIREHETV